MKKARLLMVIFGILLPYLARILGAFVNGKEWFTSFLGDGIGSVVFVEIFNAICWVSILCATFSYQIPRSVWFPAVFGFTFPALAYGVLDLSAHSTSAVALAFIPFYSLPLVAIGWLVGLWFDRRISEKRSNRIETKA